MLKYFAWPFYVFMQSVNIQNYIVEFK